MSLKILLATVAAFTVATAAEAQVAVSVWTNVPTSLSQNATIANAPGTPADVTTTVSGIDFTDAPSFNSDATTVGEFLGNPLISSAILDNSYFLLTGDISLAAGDNAFTIAHDDGFELSLDGGIGTVLSTPGPTSPTTTPFTITAPSAGTYHFTMSYGECCGGPAVLQWLYTTGRPVGSVPEPATWALMLIGFGGIGFAMRARRRRTLAQMA